MFLLPWAFLAAGLFLLEIADLQERWRALAWALLMGGAFLAARRLESGPESSPRSGGFRFPAAAWILVACAGILVRLWRLEDLSAWPILDEGQHGFYGLELARQGVGKAFYGIAQLPPLFLWLQGAIFRVFGSSLATLWLAPALFSILGMLVALHLSRRYIGSTLGFVLGVFLSLGFWPAWSARFNNWFSLGFLWEWTALWLMARAMSAEPGRTARRVWILGLWVAAGFWVMIPWPGVAVVVLAPVVVRAFGPRGDRSMRRPLILSLGLGILPFGVAAFREGYGAYILNAFSLGRGFDALAQVKAWIFYASLPWLRSSDLHAYGPVWGGLFNPVAGALLAAGILAAWRRRREPRIRWILASALFLLIPGIITRALDAFRTMQAWPFLTFLAAPGAVDLVGRFRKGRTRALAILLLASVALDAYHLGVRYPATWGNLSLPVPVMKNSELAEAYRILREEARQRGPGRLLGNLRPDAYDQTLTVAVDGFLDGPWAPGRDRNPAWTALLVNTHYRHFVKRNHPLVEWHDLGGRLGWPYGQLSLVVVPKGAVDETTLGRWIEADAALQPLTSFLLNRRLHEPDTDVLARLAALYPYFRGDPFLESCFFEKAYLYFIRAGDNRGAEESLRKALERGFPAAHFHYHLGHLARAGGRAEEARRAFERALTAPDNRTDAANQLGTP